MAGLNLLTLLDDITTLLDDVAAMSKVAAKKTAAVLGDDLALNAQQVSGVTAERELPVVWAVAKGSLRNKCILVPFALLMNYFAPWIIVPLLVLGGLFLCFEGAEKVFEKCFHHDKNAHEDENESAIANLSLEEYEKKKVAGAIRTDFILSAEIIVITLGAVQGQVMLTQIIVVSVIAFVMTLGVYGLVAGIVKLDDLGFYLERTAKKEGIRLSLGRGLITFAPKLMKTLTVVGTAAMFLVGGGIIAHNVPVVHHWIAPLLLALPANGMVAMSVPALLNGVIGLIAGGIVLALWSGIERLRA